MTESPVGVAYMETDMGWDVNDTIRIFLTDESLIPEGTDIRERNRIVVDKSFKTWNGLTLALSSSEFAHRKERLEEYDGGKSL